MLPGSYRAAGLVDDAALVRALLDVEVAWARVLGTSVSLGSWVPVLDPVEVEAAGNPVLPLVSALRARVPGPVHTGLTSQDVLDSALMLLARAVLDRVSADLSRVATGLGGLAAEHRSSVMAGRTLTQFAVPITFGLKAARWLVGVLDSLDELSVVSAGLPVQCGGAAGTLSRAASLVDPIAGASAFAQNLGLVWPGLPWHTYRAPVTRVGDALVRVCDALGVMAADVLTLGRPEIGEVSEGVVAGRGGSSTMPHKRNPVLSVLVNSAGLQAPQLGAQLHLCAARAVDERPDGAWHAEWPAFRALLELAVVAASQAAELVEGLEVHADVMARRAASAAGELLAERGSGADSAGGEQSVERGSAADSAGGELLARRGGGADVAGGELLAPRGGGADSAGGELQAPRGDVADAAGKGQLAERGGGADPATYLGAAESFVDEVLARNRSRLDPLRGEHEVPIPIVSEGSDRNGD
ncbi:lyase family protein [Lentzea aerocolonigenes]|uniref:lyase family protein n=1 Tax=Lentzea aerocolonigenes TaxID=68170 RepID=UPI0007C82B8C|nr:lyase family protein [Lentzea aerocolonigenes]